MSTPPPPPPKPRGIKHIDRKALYTDLEARVRYLHDFLDFNSDDITSLTLASKYIKALVPAVVNIVYKKLLSYDITARAFTTRSTSYEGPLDAVPSEDSPQIKYRKMFLRGYLLRICADPTKSEFWEWLDKVGMMHVGQGRKHPLHIEYIHISVLLGFIQDVIFEAVLSHPRLKLEQKIGVVKALGKVLWIQNDLFAKWYVRDGEEFREPLEGDEDDGAVEGEGYLHGKRVISDEFAEVDGGGEGGERAGGGCPFIGIVREVEDLEVAGSGIGIDGCKCGKEGGGGTEGKCPVTGSGIPRPVERVKSEAGACVGPQG
ncbi:hypothetical protein L873DRAFT_1818042 [Choiromyces venosus 120613-1]|uniref:Globin-sensor domain-containing protein n=1 Tax=Choiromyces venosus 120613-1 TaxID=1336337 RepID=A0A3N4J1A1_9PEZI|nr:hypothetical protein L873DRAFT_1818042 [Choiromyces venosus 120613-1]